jgi:outer membrane protein assembly factor BamE (lipoprotein component of BamABCDE complex)
MSKVGLGTIKGRLALGAMLALGASGCTSIHDHRGFLVDQTLVESVQPGVDNKDSVQATLGRPSFASQFGDPVWYYVAVDTRQFAFKRPSPTNELVLRIRFDATGKVLGVDKAGMERVIALNPDKGKTPTLGRTRTLLEDLFGNIGVVGTGGPGGQGPGPGGGPNGS